MTEKKFGSPVANWSPPPRPPRHTMLGRYVKLVPLTAQAHSEELYRNYIGQDHVWDYLPYGPFSSVEDYAQWIRGTEKSDDPVFYAIQNLDSGVWEGVFSFLRIAPEAGSIEIGHVNFSPALQGTRAATEALFLMMKWAFDAGYRRFEWKCDACNLPSRRAGQRLGLSFEGVFRQAAVVKGRNRDTAWFAAVDGEWPALEQAFKTWLNPENFDEARKQRASLSAMTSSIRVASDPALSTEIR